MQGCSYLQQAPDSDLGMRMADAICKTLGSGAKKVRAFLRVVYLCKNVSRCAEADTLCSMVHDAYSMYERYLCSLIICRRRCS